MSREENNGLISLTIFSVFIKNKSANEPLLEVSLSNKDANKDGPYSACKYLKSLDFQENEKVLKSTWI